MGREPVIEKSNAFAFMWQFIRHPTEVGTPFACSSSVAEKILQFVPSKSDEAHNYLEIGPGTGSFTAKLVERLGPNDRLDLVEIDDMFCKMLQKRYGHLPNVHVHHMPIQNWTPSFQYDVVIAAVPLNALPSVSILRPILASYERLTKKGGILSAVEYVGTSTLREAVLFGDKKRDFKEVVALKKEFFKNHSFLTEKVWKNMPPARVFQCRISHPIING